MTDEKDEFKKTSLKLVKEYLGEFEYPVEVFVSDNHLCISLAYPDNDTAVSAFNNIPVKGWDVNREAEQQNYNE